MSEVKDFAAFLKDQLTQNNNKLLIIKVFLSYLLCLL